MIPIDIIPPQYYALIFQWVLCVLVSIFTWRCYKGIIYKPSIVNEMNYIGKTLVVILSVIVGLRPISIYFADTVSYAATFSHTQTSGDVNIFKTFFSFKGEFFFNSIQDICIQYADIHTMFLLVAFIYFGCQYLACYRLAGKFWFAPFIAMSCMIDYWGFAVNGIRNGAAANLMILALTFGKKYSISLPLAILSIGTHKSMLLVGCAGILAHIYKKTKVYIFGWFACILVSAISGNTASNFILQHLGDADDRLSKYIRYGEDSSMMAEFSTSGFRIDFLIYSAIPIMVGYWYTQIREINDTYYKWWLNTYIITNSFWVLMMKAAFTNRFAALSWFIAGIVLMYPFFKLRFSHQQGRIASFVILVWYSFNFIQNVLRKSIFFFIQMS